VGPPTPPVQSLVPASGMNVLQESAAGLDERVDLGYYVVPATQSNRETVDGYFFNEVSTRPLAFCCSAVRCCRSRSGLTGQGRSKLAAVARCRCVRSSSTSPHCSRRDQKRAALAGRSGATVTDVLYRHRLRPVIQTR
jgi:hypothetical protein